MSDCIDHGRTGDADGYARIHKQGNWYSLHRLIAYMNEPSAKLSDSSWHACHMCDNPRCIRVEHLFVGTVSQNMSTRDQSGSRNPNTKLTDDDVRTIRQWRRDGHQIVDIAYTMDISVRAASDIINKRSWKHVE